MDQDAFRKLVASSSSSSRTAGASSSRGSILPSRQGKKAEATKNETTKPEFRPRKVNRGGKDSGYRDRAAERRQGVAGDFAHVEALLENFEKQHANDEDKQAVEEKRRYLGGDLEHTVLVKGLDYALIEQIRAREAAKSSVEDEESLESAFRSVAASHGASGEGTINGSSSSKGKKRTREDIIRELKEKRAKGGPEEDVVNGEKGKGIEEAKIEGKFRPIGFKPIGSEKKKAKESEGSKKKKRKVDGDVGKVDVSANKSDRQSLPDSNANNSKASAALPTTKSQPPQPLPEPIDDDDIFADAGEYEGLKLDDDDSGEEGEVKGDNVPASKGTDEDPPLLEAPRKWFDEDEDEMVVDDTAPPALEASPKHQDKGKQPVKLPEVREEEDESEGFTRLAPLQSSAVPSIRDILAADEALEAQEKRKARKEKRKAGGGGGEDGFVGEGKTKKKVSAETKLNREYKKLQAYTEKKGQQL